MKVLHIFIICVCVTSCISMRLVENNSCSSNGNGNICSPNTVTSSSTTTSNSAGAKTGTDATPKVSQNMGLRNKLKTSPTNGKSSNLTPHILVVLFDDLGYHDLGEFSDTKRHLCSTPVMNNLMNTGIKLKKFYSMPICSPTRAALMTGRYPIRYGGHVGTTPGLAADQGWAPIGEPIMAERFQDIGYSTYMAGKWHLGRAGHPQTPTGRGFQEFYGKYEGGGDHWTHTTDIRADSRDGSVWPGHPDYTAASGAMDLKHDRWILNKNTGKKSHVHEHIFHMNGTHSSDVFGMAAEKMILSHDADKPMFMYLPFQAPHWPVQNPAGTEEIHEHIPGKQRRKWCGLISHIDQNVGRVISALKAKKMYENTFIFVFSDNGGDVRTGASNHPYRGDKMSPWEGGTKSPAFIHSANRNLIPENLRGTESQALGHVTDLFPTLLGMVGGDTSPTKTGPLDGYDLYSAWKSGSNDSPRKEMLYNIDPFGLATAASGFMAGNVNSLGKRTQAPDPRMMTRMGMNGNIPEDYAAIRVGKYKLITGQPGRSDWYGTDPSETWKAAYIMGPDATNYELLESGGPYGDMKLSDAGQAKVKREKLYKKEDFERTVKQLFLFDLDVDPAEHNDISAHHPDIVEKLKARLETYAATMAEPLLRVPDTVWTKEKKAHMKARRRTGQRRFPGVPVVVADWWDTEEEMAKNMQSKL